MTDRHDYRPAYSPIEHEIARVHDELTDPELMSTYNAARKRRMKMDVASTLLDEEIRSLKDHIEKSTTIIINDAGLAEVDDGQPPLQFGAPDA